MYSYEHLVIFFIYFWILLFLLYYFFMYLLIDWLIDWLVDWLIDWLIDWFIYFNYFFFNFQTFIPRELRRETNKIYKKMTLHEFISYTGLGAGSSNVGIFYSFFFFTLHNFLHLHSKFTSSSSCSSVEQKFERARIKKAKDRKKF